LLARKSFGSAIAIGALVLGACASAADDAGQATTTLAATEPNVSESSVAPTTIQSTSTEETGVTPVTDALDPAGSVAGGSTDRSYQGEAFPTELTGIIGLAADDLAAQLGIDSSAIKVVLVEEVVWSDASLGCPQPGMSYAQVLTDGMRIVLEAAGELYDYRTNGIDDPILCVKATDKDESRAGIFHVTDEGEIVILPPQDPEEKAPTEGINPPDE
jgi:hypothetical protein